MEVKKQRTMFEIFGDSKSENVTEQNTTPDVEGETSVAVSNPPVREFQVNSKQKNPVNFSFSTVKPETSTDNDTGKKPDNKEDSYMYKNDFFDVVEDIECLMNMAIALVAVLGRKDVNWRGTAERLSVPLGEYMHKLKDFAAKM